MCAALETAFGPAGSAGSHDGAAWYRSPCLGLCDRAPAVMVERAGVDHQAGRLTHAQAAAVMGILNGGWPPDEPAMPARPDGASPLLRRVGVVDPQSLDSYRAAGGYTAFRSALELGPEGVIREVTDARLLGRGGAAFPTGRKWDAVARTPARPHHLVCNADESEPGTFKDRVLMEGDPFAVVEAMTIAALATGCEQGYLYVRGEYPVARRRI
jgi:NADH-quinone oxidoreductase subunit F